MAEERSPRVQDQDSPENRRRDHRYLVEADISLESDHNFYAGFVENLSVSGIFIATHKLRKIGEEVEFSLRLGESDEVLRGVGEVRWIRQYSETSDVPPGMGLRFVELSPEAHLRIDSFLRNREPLFFDDDLSP